MKKQFSDVPCRFGAPMGRPSFRGTLVAPVAIEQVRAVDGSYDDGGAYWGMPNAANDTLYVATDAEGNQDFVRDNSRQGAAIRLGLPPPTDISLDDMLYGFLDVAAEDENNRRADDVVVGDSYEGVDYRDVAPRSEEAALAAIRRFVDLAKEDLAGLPETLVGSALYMERFGGGMGFEKDWVPAERQERLEEACKAAGMPEELEWKEQGEEQ